jgi:hypothetical protein
MGHEDALAAVAPDAELVQDRTGSGSEREALELKTVVWSIYCKECGEPRTARSREKLRRSMDESFAVVEVRARLDAIGSRT